MQKRTRIMVIICMVVYIINMLAYTMETNYEIDPFYKCIYIENRTIPF